MDTQNFEFAFLNLPVLCITFSACILCSFFAKHFKQCKCKINCYLFIYHNQRQVDLSAFEFGYKNRALFGTFTFSHKCHLSMCMLILKLIDAGHS